MSDLAVDLRAADLLREHQPSCGLSGAFDSPDEFALALENLAKLVERSSRNPFLIPKQLFLRVRAKIWFIPTSEWDDIAGVVGDEAVDLGNRIYAAL